MTVSKRLKPSVTLRGLLAVGLWVQLLALSASASELIVVQEGGVSALHYYESLSIQSGEKAIHALPQVPRVSAADERHMLPVTSKTLSPGKVQARTLSASGLVRPVFLVGSDDVSRAWLMQRGDILRRLEAVGLAVEVPDMQALSAIREAANGLTILPVSGDDIGALLGITHYPVLLTKTGMEQ